eukprot:1050344-Pleurochrysis_carterae.AAC.1
MRGENGRANRNARLLDHILSEALEGHATPRGSRLEASCHDTQDDWNQNLHRRKKRTSAPWIPRWQRAAGYEIRINVSSDRRAEIFRFNTGKEFLSLDPLKDVSARLKGGFQSRTTQNSVCVPTRPGVRIYRMAGFVRRAAADAPRADRRRRWQAADLLPGQVLPRGPPRLPGTTRHR